MIYNQTKQDGLFFVGTPKHTRLLNDLQTMVPDMFRSDCPIFMPMKYSNAVEMKLDRNIIFYKSDEDEKYSLVDKFAIKGGPVIGLEVGAWDKSNGVQLDKRTNRWDRRTDLMGAKLTSMDISQSGGLSQKAVKNRLSRPELNEMSYYFAETINLTI